MFSQPQPARGFFLAQLTLRVFTIAFTLSAIGFMVTSEQSVSIFGIDMKASYTYSTALRFKLVADAVVSVCSFLSLIFACALNCPKSQIRNYFLALLHDMVMMALVVSGCSAATAIGYVGRFGQDQIGWMAICDRVGKFCDKLMVSILFSYLAFFCLLMLATIAAHKLKSLALE